jgi:uncharacterized protein (TIGR03083 family)
VAIDAELQGLDPVDLMGAEAARIEAYVAALPSADWLRPSRCEGWTVRDVVAHLAASEAYHRARLDGEVRAFFEGTAANGVDSVDAFNAVGIAGFAGVPTPAGASANVAAVAGRGASQHVAPDVCAALSTMP